MGVSAIIRMSFALACFHTIVLIIILGRNTASAVFHDGCWLAKSLMVFTMFVGFMWIPNGFFHGYMSFARFVSVFFMIY